MTTSTLPQRKGTSVVPTEFPHVKNPTILIVDPSHEMFSKVHSSIRSYRGLEKSTIVNASTLSEAHEKLLSRNIDFVLSAEKLDDGKGADFLRNIVEPYAEQAHRGIGQAIFAASNPQQYSDNRRPNRYAVFEKSDQEGILSYMDRTLFLLAKRG